MNVWCAAPLLVLPLWAQSERAPDINQQESMLARITEHSLHSQDQLPDFICTQLTNRSEDKSGKGTHWKKVDSLEVEFSFIGRKPRWKLRCGTGSAKNRAHKRGGPGSGAARGIAWSGDAAA